MKILSLDPGKGNNFAYALLVDGICVKTGLLWTIKDLTPPKFKSDYVKFRKEFDDLIKTCNLTSQDKIIIERFMARPGKGSMGASSEFINIMIGIITQSASVSDIEVSIIPASQWKNHLRNKFYIGKTAKIRKSKNNNTSSPKKVKASTTSKKKMLYENFFEYLCDKYPESLFKDEKKKDSILVIHQGDAIAIGSYWFEQITGKSVLLQTWDPMHKMILSFKNQKKS